jgi:hypothetical protein
MKTIIMFYFFAKISKGDLYNRDLSIKTLEWMYFFEDPNSKGITIDHMQIYRG